MSLESKTTQILNNFDSTNSEEIIDILNQIKNQLTSALTIEYLGGKIQGIIDANDEFDKKKLCKNLRPYLDWYLQGI